MQVKRWVCINKRFSERFLLDTLAYTRTKSIQLFIQDTSDTWIRWKKIGWRCVKVNLTIEEI